MSRVRFVLKVAASALVVIATQDVRWTAHAQTEGPDPAQRLARGAYIVEQVAQCGRCHTPVNRHGQRDNTRRLMGGPLDVEPTIAKDEWAMAAPRLAGTPPGTDEEFVKLMMTGISRTGRKPLRPMPQFQMTQEDAESVLSYLKSLRTDRR